MPINNISQIISIIPEAGRRGIDVQTIFVNKQEDFQDHLTDVTVTELNNLKTQMNTMAGEMNTTASQVNTNTNTATTKANEASASATSASASATSATTSRNQAETFAQQAQASAASVDANNIVHRTGNEIIDGVKTFSSNPIVPTPTAGDHAANKLYVDSLKTIATGTATFNSATNNINLTGIGIGVEIGDVIQISGADDTKNNSEFTVEVITDNNNIIVNQAHANTGTTKNVANRSGDTGVTVKLLAKWYNAPSGLGQGWVTLTSSRASTTVYLNNTKRKILVTVTQNTAASALELTVGGERYSYDLGETGATITATMEVNTGEMYTALVPLSNFIWRERR